MVRQTLITGDLEINFWNYIVLKKENVVYVVCNVLISVAVTSLNNL